MSEHLKRAFAAILLIALVVGPTVMIAYMIINTERGEPSVTSAPDPEGYSTCSEAHDAGVYDIPEDSPAYKQRQDADNDGYACEPYYGR